MEMLVRWDGLDANEATWEDATKLFKVFPKDDLKDKMHLLAGTDTETEGVPLFMTYQRRRRGNERKTMEGTEAKQEVR